MIIGYNFNAKEFIKKNTLEYYWISERQVTIAPFGPYGFEYILNKDGLVVFDNIKYKISKEMYDGIIIDYYILKHNSGPWLKVTSNNFSNAKHPDIIDETFNNIKIQGVGADGKYMTTSYVLFKIDNYVYTINNSLYKLEGNCKGIIKMDKN